MSKNDFNNYSDCDGYDGYGDCGGYDDYWLWALGSGTPTPNIETTPVIFYLK